MKLYVMSFWSGSVNLFYVASIFKLSSNLMLMNGVCSMPDSSFESVLVLLERVISLGYHYLDGDYKGRVLINETRLLSWWRLQACFVLPNIHATCFCNIDPKHRRDTTSLFLYYLLYLAIQPFCCERNV